MRRMYLVADGDRQRASQSLRRHYVRGRLTFEELSERTELALRARTDGELRAALRDLPAPWNPRELAPVAEAAGRAAGRALLFFALAGLWCVVTFVLLIVYLVAVAVDASTLTELGVLLLWASVTYLVWRAWRRPARRA
jgi:hypothetical protein